MEQIKYRAWNSNMKKMFSPEEMASDQMALLPTGFFINIHPNPALSVIYAHAEMLPLLFSGISDKNAVEIYEGDIVRTTHTGDEAWRGVQEFVIKTPDRAMYGLWAEEIRSGPNLDSLEFHMDGQTRERRTIHMSPGVWGGRTNLEVIGDIYRTPELLV